MQRWMHLALAIGLTGCAAPEPIMIERTTVEVCPPEAPTDTCPDFPVLGTDVTIEQLEDAWIDGKKVYAECAAVVSEWRSAWDSCPRK